MSNRQDHLSADVTYNSDGNPKHVKVYDGDDKLCRATMNGSSAVIQKMYPYPEYSYVAGDTCVLVMDYLDSLPFVQATTFGEVDE